MKFTVFPQGQQWRWILREGVEVVMVSDRLDDQRSAIEAARRFKHEVATAWINTEERPWWPESTKTKQP